MIRAIPTEPFCGNEEACPVPDSFLAKLYRSTAGEARDLCLALPEQVRAQLALFCSARVHLRELARTIAAICPRASLVHEGRENGRVLWEEAMRRSHEPCDFHGLRKAVTLAGPSAATLRSAPEADP